MLLILNTELGSSAVAPKSGRRSVKGLMGDDFEQSVEESIRTALQGIIREGSVELLSVDVQRGQLGHKTTVSYTDLTTGDTDSLTI
jgi:hypothetical protein